jgi:hypothetical protein
MALATGLVSCRNDLDVLAPYRDIPVVYCIINPKEPVQYLRLEKSFLGEASALVMARNTDSIYYPEATVLMERWADGEPREKFILERVETAARDSGIFTSNPNLLYTLTSPVKAGYEYRLSIRIPSTGAEINAITQTIGEFKVIKPEGFKKSLPFSSYDNYQKVQWISAPFSRIYQLTLRFHYLEVTGADTSKMTAEWNIGQFVSKLTEGGDIMETEILQRNFYKWVGNKLRTPAANVHRLAAKQAIDFVFTVGGDDLYTYIEVYKEDTGLPREKPVFTNLTSGIGIFAAKSVQSVDGKALSDHSVDSLAYGIYTRHLRFADSQNDYYYGGL